MVTGGAALAVGEVEDADEELEGVRRALVGGAERLPVDRPGAAVIRHRHGPVVPRGEVEVDRGHGEVLAQGGVAERVNARTTARPSSRPRCRRRPRRRRPRSGRARPRSPSATPTPSTGARGPRGLAPSAARTRASRGSRPAPRRPSGRRRRAADRGPDRTGVQARRDGRGAQRRGVPVGAPQALVGGDAQTEDRGGDAVRHPSRDDQWGRYHGTHRSPARSRPRSPPSSLAQRRTSYLSLSMTFAQAATKSWTNFSCDPSCA